MHKLTGKQSRQARSLLKWNIHDLANRVKNIPPKRLDSFENGMVHFMAWENDELVRAFRKAGIHFNTDMDVTLHKARAEPVAAAVTAKGEGARIVIGAELDVVSDSTSDKVKGPDLARPGETSKEDENKSQ